MKEKYYHGGTFEKERDAAVAVNNLCQIKGVPLKNPALEVILGMKSLTMFPFFVFFF